MERHTSFSTRMVVSTVRVIVPGCIMWCGETPKGIVGVTSTGTSNRRAASRETYSTVRWSVSSGRCRPCCSVEAMGTITTVPRLAHSGNSPRV